MNTLKSIWEELNQPLRLFIGKRVADASAVDDLAQEVMLKIQTQLDALPPEDKLPRWVYQIARNAIVDYYRARALRQHVEIDSAGDVAAQAGEREEMIRQITPCLRKMIQHLPEPYREALILAELEGLSQQDLAERAGISLSGVKSRVQRARQQLRELIVDCCRLERDGRGNVFDYQTTDRSARYCGDDDSEGGACQ